jgi:hypothetical protein
MTKKLGLALTALLTPTRRLRAASSCQCFHECGAFVGRIFTKHEISASIISFSKWTLHFISSSWEHGNGVSQLSSFFRDIPNPLGRALFLRAGPNLGIVC